MGLAAPFAGEIARFLMRYRWGWALLSVVALSLGAFITLNAPQIRFVAVSGVVAQVTPQGSASDGADALRLVSDKRQFLLHPQGFHPVMATPPEPGATVKLWIETDNLIAYAVQVRDASGQARFYQSDLYEHRALVQPLVFGGGALLMVAGVVFAAVAAFFPQYQRRMLRRRKPRQPRASQQPPQSKLRYVPAYLQDYQPPGYTDIPNPHERQ